MLFRKLLRDIRRHFFQFLSVFLMTFLSIHFYTGITQEWKGLRNNVDKYYDMTNLADYFLYSDESFSKEDLEKILKMDKVSDAERTLVFETKANLEGNPNIKLHVMEKGAITKPYLVSGEEFNAKSSGIWIDKRFKDARNLNVGDEITLSFKEDKVKGKIKGIIYSPEYVFFDIPGRITPDFYQAGYAYISANMFFSQVVGKEIAEKVKDGENALADAKTKLKEAEDKINSGKRELAENKEKYEREFAEKKKLIANGEKELNKVNKQIKSGFKGLSAGKLKFNEKKREFLNAKTEYEKNLKEYEKKSLELKKAEEKISESENSLNYLRVLLEKSKAEYENTLKENNLEKELSVILSEAELELLQLKNLLKNNPGDLTLKKKIAEKEKFIAFIKVLTEKKAELENGFKDLSEKESLLAKSKKEIEAGKSQLAMFFAKLNEAKEKLDFFEGKIIVGEREIAEKEKLLKNGERQYKEKLRELEKGKNLLLTKENEFKNSIAEAQKKLEDGEKTFNKEKEKALKEIKDGEEKLKEAEEKLKRKEIPYHEIMIKSSEKDKSVFQKNLKELFSDNNFMLIPKDTHVSVAMFEGEINQHKSMGSTFPLVFLVVGLLTMVTTMIRIINKQRIQIGTMKALGFKDKVLVRHYISYPIVITFLGAMLGAITGPMVLPKLFYPSMSSFYTLPFWDTKADFTSYIVVIFTVFLAAFFSYFTIRKNFRENPAQTLKPKEVKENRASFFEKSFIWKKLGFSTRWNIRDMRRNKLRSLMAILGIMGSVVLTLSSFGIKDALGDITKWQFEDLQNYETKIVFQDKAQDSYKYEMKKKYPSELVQETAIEVQMPKDKKIVPLTVLEEGKYLRLTFDMKKIATLPKEGIAFSRKLAEKYDIKKGDEVKIKSVNEKKAVSVKVNEIIRDPSKQGITISAEEYKKLGFEFLPDYIVTSEILSEKDFKNDENISKVISKQEALKDWNELLKSIKIMNYVLMSGAVFLSLIVLYNLGVLAISEMQIEFATMKVLGFQSSVLKNLLLRQNIFLSILGFLLGIPLGRMLLNIMMQDSENFDMYVNLYPMNLILSYLFVLCVIYVISLIFKFKIKKVNMVSALKSTD